MLRTILTVVAGLVTWWAIAVLLGFGTRAAWPAYAAAEPDMQFTLGMLVARLSIGALATLGAALVTRRIGTRGSLIGLGAVLLLFFIPVHIGLFDAFPLWYHAVFLLSLPTIVAITMPRKAVDP